MKLSHLLLGIIIVFLFADASFSYYIKPALKDKDIIRNINDRSFYEKKIEILNAMKTRSIPYKNNSSSINAYLIIGAAAFAGFILSVTVFNEEIFGTLPLTLFAAGVLFIIIGS